MQELQLWPTRTVSKSFEITSSSQEVRQSSRPCISELEAYLMFQSFSLLVSERNKPRLWVLFVTKIFRRMICKVLFVDLWLQCPSLPLCSVIWGADTPSWISYQKQWSLLIFGTDVDERCTPTRENCRRHFYVTVSARHRFLWRCLLASLPAYRKTQMFLLVQLRHWHDSLTILLLDQTVNHVGTQFSPLRS